MDLGNKTKKSVIYWKIWKSSDTEVLKAFEHPISLFQQLKLLVQIVLLAPKWFAFHLTFCITLSNFNLWLLFRILSISSYWSLHLCLKLSLWLKEFYTNGWKWKSFKGSLAYGMLRQCTKLKGELWDAQSASFTWNSGDEEKYSTALQRILRKSIKLMKCLYNKLERAMNPQKNRETIQKEITVKNTNWK